MEISSTTQSLQDKFAPQSICFGCGPNNPHGLKIKSFVEGSKVVASFTPKPYHHAFPSILNGGIIGAILDCHCNWAASWYFMQKNQLNEPPCTVTAEYKVKLKKPTPINCELTLIAELNEIGQKKAIVSANLIANNQVYDEFTGIFIIVKPSHPAYHRW